MQAPKIIPMSAGDGSRGHLNPSPDATISRVGPPADLYDAVVHFWIPEWDLPPGETSRQVVLTYPVVNLVMQPGAPEGDLTLHGPQTRLSHRDLTGRGWAVGALLRPAAVPVLLGLTPQSPADGARALVDACVALDEPRLVSEVSGVMQTNASRRHERAVALVSAWLGARLADARAPDRDGLLANALLDALDVLPTASPRQRPAGSLQRVADVARELGTSTRTLQRVSLAHTGFTPAALIRRRRLQDAADRLRHTPPPGLTQLAQDVGYADHAHLARDFRSVLRVTPSGYRDRGVFPD